MIAAVAATCYCGCYCLKLVFLICVFPAMLRNTDMKMVLHCFRANVTPRLPAEEQPEAAADEPEEQHTATAPPDEDGPKMRHVSIRQWAAYYLQIREPSPDDHRLQRLQRLFEVPFAQT